jgi:hypothetical protein
VVLGLLSPREAPELAMAWSERNDPDGFPTLIPSDPALGKEYRVSGIPHTYIVSPEGTVVFSSTGWNEEKKEELIRVLDEILPGS